MNLDNTMKNIPEEERPYEKCLHYGVKRLSDAELLAVILRSGTVGLSALDLAKKLLYSISLSKGILSIHHFTMEQLMKIKGIGKVKAIQILCLSELAKRLSKAEASSGLCFEDARSIAQYVMEELRHEKQEHIKVLMLDGRDRLIGESNISKGTVNASLLSPRDLFIEALQKNAVSIFLIHNHPSGDSTPSNGDLRMTRRVKQVGELVGIELKDHIIIGNNCYTSFLEEGLM